MGDSYAAREGDTSAEVPEGQQQKSSKTSSRRRNKCSKYRAYLFRDASTECIGVILAAETLRVLEVCVQYY